MAQTLLGWLLVAALLYTGSVAYAYWRWTR